MIAKANAKVRLVECEAVDVLGEQVREMQAADHLRSGGADKASTCRHAEDAVCIWCY